MDTQQILYMFPPQAVAYRILDGYEKNYEELMKRYSALQHYTKGYLRWDGFPEADSDDAPKEKYIGFNLDAVIDPEILENLTYVGVGTYDLYEDMINKYGISRDLSMEEQTAELVKKLGYTENSSNTDPSLEEVLETAPKIDADGNPTKRCSACASWEKLKELPAIIPEGVEVKIHHNNSTPPPIPLRGQVLSG